MKVARTSLSLKSENNEKTLKFAESCRKSWKVKAEPWSTNRWKSRQTLIVLTLEQSKKLSQLKYFQSASSARNFSQISSRKKIFLQQRVEEEEENNCEKSFLAKGKLIVKLFSRLCVRAIVGCASLLHRWLCKRKREEEKKTFPTNTLKCRIFEWIFRLFLLLCLRENLFSDLVDSLICLFAALMIVSLISVGWDSLWTDRARS